MSRSYIFLTVLDIGEGYLEGSCSGSTVDLIVYLTKPGEIEMVQYAVGSPADWPAGMVTCTPDVCSISEDGKQIYVTLEGYSGVVTSLSTDSDLIRKLINLFLFAL